MDKLTHPPTNQTAEASDSHEHKGAIDEIREFGHRVHEAREHIKDARESFEKWNERVIEPAMEKLGESAKGLLERVPEIKAAQGELAGKAAELASKGMSTVAEAGSEIAGKVFVEGAVLKETGKVAFETTRDIDENHHHILSGSKFGQAEGSLLEKTGVFERAMQAGERADEFKAAHPRLSALTGGASEVAVEAVGFVTADVHARDVREHAAAAALAPTHLHAADGFTLAVQHAINQDLNELHHPSGSISLEEAHHIANAIRNAGPNDTLTIDKNHRVEIHHSTDGATHFEDHAAGSAVFSTGALKEYAMDVGESFQRAQQAAQHTESHQQAAPQHSGPEMGI